jgi:hypothetical protein
MFFVRVNRFWCVWMRVLVFGVGHVNGWRERLVRVFGNGLSDLVRGVIPAAIIAKNSECSDV